MDRASLPRSYFDQLYSADGDPWRIAEGWYERRKRAISLAALSEPTYRAVLEIGCGNGELTVELAPRCDRLVALDTAEDAVVRTRARLAAAEHVEVVHQHVPGELPAGPFDLIVLSEVGYYLSVADLADLVHRLVVTAADDAELLAVHWRHPAEGYPQRGDEVHRTLDDHPGLVSAATYLDEDFRLGLYGVGSRAASVAARTGVLG